MQSDNKQKKANGRLSSSSLFYVFPSVTLSGMVPPTSTLGYCFLYGFPNLSRPESSMRKGH